MLKTHKLSSSSNSYIQNGTSYAYVDASTTSFEFLSKDITLVTSPLGLTLHPLYAGSAELSFMYNDETPDNKTSSSYGHTKGVIAANGTEGFWLIHSVPSFPPEPDDGYSYPSSGLRYAQSFLCLSLSLFLF